MNDEAKFTIIEENDAGVELFRLPVDVPMSDETVNNLVNQFNDRGEFNARLDGFNIRLVRRDDYVSLRPIEEIKAELGAY